jgi:nucleoside-diphosphate-sugar epimerase
VTRSLLNAGTRVVVYDLQPRGNVLDMLLPRHQERANAPILEQGEITDGFRLLAICRKYAVDSIVHLASPLTMDVVANPWTGVRDICTGTLAVFSTAREAKLRRVVWTSSVAVYGSRKDYTAGALGEAAFHNPANLYGASKSLCEVMARQLAETDNLDIVGLRLSVVYGAGRRRGYMTYPSALMRDAATSESVTVPFGDQRLHWQYVEEVADMVRTALAADRRSAGAVYNAFGDTRSWRDAANILKTLRPALNVEVRDQVDEALVDTVEDYDTSGFASAYGAKRQWPLERGIADTLATYTMFERGAQGL